MGGRTIQTQFPDKVNEKSWESRTVRLFRQKGQQQVYCPVSLSV